MPITSEQIPLTDTLTPADPAAVAEAIRAAHDTKTPIYPLAGNTAQNYGIAPTRPGRGLDLSSLVCVVDYTPRDMTILVEAGIRMADLAETLAAEGQHLPIDVPRAGEATLGGVVATNWNGPRRPGHGTIRDYVIGIHAVDGRGIAFKGGGRVVKNVAGYDFCKLLTGSMGTLGVITQVALKVKPQSETSATVTTDCSDLKTAEQLLSRLVNLPAPPVAVDLLVGSAWELDNSSAMLSVLVEGTAAEVNWLADAVQYEFWNGGGANVHRLAPADADALWINQVEFADRGPTAAPDNSPLALKVAVPPRAVVSVIGQLRTADPDCTIQAHAASGIIYVRFAKFRPADLTAILVGKLRPAAVQLGGSLVVTQTTLEGLTPHMIWGGRSDTTVLLERIRNQFDPHNILNPDRITY